VIVMLIAGGNLAWAQPARSPAKRAKAAAKSDAELLGATAGGDWTAPAKPAEPPQGAAEPRDASDLLALARRHNARPFSASERPGAFRPMPAKEMSSPVSFTILSRDDGTLRLRIAHGQPLLTPAASGSRVFIGGGFTSRTLHCVDATTGQTQWSVGFKDNGPSSPAYADGVVLFNTESCTVYALDADTGQLLWSSYLSDQLVGMPSIAGGDVLVCYRDWWRPPRPAPENAARRDRRSVSASSAERLPEAEYPPTARLAALDLRTGKPRWAKWLDQHVISAPIVYGDEIYATTFAGTLYKLRLSDGEILIARRCGARSAPVVTGEAIFVTARGEGGRELQPDSLLALDRTTGKLLEIRNVEDASVRHSTSPLPNTGAARHDAWMGQLKPFPNLRPTSALQEYSGPRLLAVGGRLYGCLGANCFAKDEHTGEHLWGLYVASGKRDESLVSSPIASAGGRLFLATTGGELLQIEPTHGVIERRFPLKAPAITEPIIERGRAFVGTRDGQLLCIDLGDERFTGWNQWGGNAAHCAPEPPYPAPVPVRRAEVREASPSGSAAGN
jgi:outer membrane protein assembly factor BamB